MPERRREKVNAVMGCARCGTFCEHPQLMEGYIPKKGGGTKKVDTLALCLTCREMQHENLKKFWNEGWGL